MNTSSSKTNEMVWQLAERYLPQLLEPGPNRFHYYHKKKSASMKKRLKSGSQKIIKFREDMNRNRFLYNCLILTEEEPIEYLIVGYGYVNRHTTEIEQAQIIPGSSNRVGIPYKVDQNIKNWIEEDEVNEVILFHNHPEHWVNAFLSYPRPSGTDRDTMTRYKSNPSYIVRRILGGGGGIMFFLGQNGEVKEFWLPRVSVIRKLLNEVQKLQSTSYGY
jgi:hypothetical protein